MKVIFFNSIKVTTEKKRSKLMYENLIDELNTKQNLQITMS